MNQDLISPEERTLQIKKSDGHHLSWNLSGILFLLGKPGFGIAHLLSSELARRKVSVRIIFRVICFDIFQITDFMERAGDGFDFSS